MVRVLLRTHAGGDLGRTKAPKGFTKHRQVISFVGRWGDTVLGMGGGLAPPNPGHPATIELADPKDPNSSLKDKQG